MKIQNNPEKREKSIEIQRGAIEHRAIWMYLLMDEARKRGLDWDGFARSAILRCGHFHGTTKFPRTESLEKFGIAFATEELKKVFDMDVVACNDDEFIVEFHYCPLLTGWLTQTDNLEDLEKLCDIAMEGDRGIVAEYPSFAFDLQSTIARGDKVCRVVISRDRS